MMKLSSDNGSITPRRAAARRLSIPYRTPLVPLLPSRRWCGTVEGERERGGGAQEKRASLRRTVYLPWRLFMLADGHLCCTHIALRGRSRDPRAGAPLLSPWPGHRRVMANALRIKCILSLTVRWHRCLGNIEITPFPSPLPSSSPPAPLVSIGYFLVSRLSRSRREFRLPPSSERWDASLLPANLVVASLYSEL